MKSISAYILVFTRKVILSKYFPLLVFFIPFLGLLLSFYGFETAFQRSGAILVGLTILNLALNNKLFWELDFSESIRKDRKKLNTHPELDVINRIKEQVTDIPNIEKFLKGTLDEEGSTPLRLRKEAITLQQYEVLIGFFGTLIWAFGDIPFLK